MVLLAPSAEIITAKLQTLVRVDARDIGHSNLIRRVLLELPLQRVGRDLGRPAHLVARPLVAPHRPYLSHSREPSDPVLAALHACLPRITKDSGLP